MTTATESLSAIFPHLDADEVFSALRTCDCDEEAAASMLLDKHSGPYKSDTCTGIIPNSMVRSCLICTAP